MKRALIGVALVTSFGMGVGTAFAADMYGGGSKDRSVYAAPGWSGWYAGVNGGGWYANTPDVNYFAVGAGLVATSTGLEGRGGFGGGQIGFNWQQGQLVYGLEADIQGAGIQSKIQFSSPDDVNAGRGKDELVFFGTVRGRLGYAFGSTLLYATGGFAYGDVHRSVDIFAGSEVGATFARNRTDVGFAVGGGIEYKFTPAWSVKVEYQLIDLGSEELMGTAPAAGGISTYTNGLDETYHTARVGVNYQFVPAYEPLK
jgi:outer membrane immunogenic protein